MGCGCSAHDGDAAGGAAALACGSLAAAGGELQPGQPGIRAAPAHARTPGRHTPRGGPLNFQEDSQCDTNKRVAMLHEQLDVEVEKQDSLSA